MTLTWFFNGRKIENQPNFTINKMSKRTTVLMIESVSINSIGNYTCVAKNAAGISEHTATLNVIGIKRFYHLLYLVVKFSYYKTSQS